MKKLLTTSILLMTLLAARADSVLTGVIQEIQVGDYYHIVVKDGKGKEHSFFVGRDKSFDGIVEKPEKFKGKKVRLHWHSIKKDIPEAGGPMQIDEATRLEFLK